MRRWQRAVLWGVAGLVLLLAVAALSLQVLVDRDRLTQIVRDRISQSLEREVTLGEVSIKLLPLPHVYARNVAIANPAWARDRNLLQASGISARFALLPLLGGKFVIRTLYADGVKLSLETDSTGRRNWELPKKNDTTTDNIGLTALQLTDGEVVWRDAEGRHLDVQLDTLTARAGSNLRDVVFEAQMHRNGQLLKLDGKLDDLSAAGSPGALTAGTVNARIGPATLSITGLIPLHRDAPRLATSIAVDAPSLQQAYTFFGIKERSPVPLKASVNLQGDLRVIEIPSLQLEMGALHMNASGKLDLGGRLPRFDARVRADHVDMIQTFLDAGRPPLPPKKPNELFRDHPLAWPLLVALDGTQGHLDASIAKLTLRSGIEVGEAAARLDFDGDRMTVPHFSGKLLGGTASGDAVIEGKKKAVTLNLKLDDTLLARWFSERGSKVALQDGRMQVELRAHASGTSLRDLAASMTGPLDIRIGDARVLSDKAGMAEFWLTGLLSAKDADSIDLSCVSAHLPFRAGVAQGEGIAGARSDVSQLLTSGTVDLRSQTLDLRGRVRPRDGVSLGWSSLGGNIKIVGPIKKPDWRSDETGKVGTIARVGAAILTSGVSIIATSIWDGANPQSDPCQIVFASKKARADATGNTAPSH